jgi:Zn ribbon nucleic-acid-binding protein
MTACPLCPRTAPDGQHLCQLHAGELRGWLGELPRQARLLEAFAAAGGRPAEGRLGGTGRAHAPLPVDLRVLVLLGPGHYDPPGDADTDTDTTVPIRALLGGWAGHIAYQYPAAHRDPYGTARTQPCDQASPRHGETITGWCAWLTAYLPYALTLPLATDLHHGLGDLIRRLRHLTHTTPQQHPRAAPCPACDISALVRTDGRWHIHCLNCGHQLTPEQYDQHATRVLHATRTATT